MRIGRTFSPAEQVEGLYGCLDYYRDVTDPFSDLKLYYKAPLYLMKGELIDPGLEKHVKHA